MHPEHIERAISAAQQGSKVGIYAQTLTRVQDLAKDVEDAVSGPLERVSHLNGRYRLDFHGGGSIQFFSLRAHSTRGVSLDRVLLPITTAPEALAEVVPSLMTSSEGVLTGY